MLKKKSLLTKKGSVQTNAFFSNTIYDPTDVISYENKNRNFTQISQTLQFNGPTFPLRNLNVPENNKVKPDGISGSFLSSFNNINSFCDEALYKTENPAEPKTENEMSHKQAILCLESEVNNREKTQRYEELLRRKKALEFFYNKTLKEMNDLELGDFSTPKVPN